MSDRGREFVGQNVAVIGLAATGLATAKALSKLGALVTVYESKSEAGVDPARVAEARAIPGLSLVFRSNEPNWETTDLVIPSPGVPRYAPSLAGAVSRGVPVLGEIEVAYRLAETPILAITGTNGKTTTTALLGAICKEAGFETWVAGNIAEDAGRRMPLIRAATEASSDAVIVAEISSFQLEWVEQFRPHVAAWLNLTADHMDRHKNIEEYAQAKANIFRAQQSENWAILNADDPLVMMYSKGVGKGTRWLFSLDGPPEGDDLYSCLTENGMLVADDGYSEVPLMNAKDILLPGRHNVANVLAAATMALAFGIDRRDIAAVIKGFRGVPHRMETIATVDDVRYINNSMCTNPAAVEASVSAVDGPLIAIAGGQHKGGDLGPMARSLARKAHVVVLIGEAADEIADALNLVGFYDCTIADSLEEAVERAAAIAEPGETVMLVPGCASFDMFSGFEERGQVFRDAVKALRQQE